MHPEAIRMKYRDFEELVKPTVADLPFRSESPDQLFFDVTACTVLQIRSTFVLPQCVQVTLADDSDIGRTISNVF